MTIHDHILFRMPKDRELQFPAMAILQEYVNGYKARAEAGPPVPVGFKAAGGPAEYRLHYHLEMGEDDIQFFQRIGLELVQLPEGMDWTADMVVNLREERLALFQDCGKHVCQIYSIMCGASCPPIPKIWRVRPVKQGPWGVFLDLHRYSIEEKLEENARWTALPWSQLYQAPITGDGIVTIAEMHLPTAPWIGVIGRAGWETYLAASMGLPVIEIVPEGRPRNWLSKFTNTAYRPVEEAAGHVQEQILEAAHNLEAMVAHMAEKQIEAREEQQEVPADV